MYPQLSRPTPIWHSVDGCNTVQRVSADNAFNEMYEEYGRYVLVKALGKGGMGVVYLAKDRERQGSLVALKRLRPDAAVIDTFEERFAHEAELAKLLSHPNLVHTYDAGEIGQRPYIAWELIFGQDIRAISDHLMARGRGAPTAVAIRVALDALAALAYLHAFRDDDGQPLNLIHRDVTPGNIMLGYDGRARLADLGLAKSKLTEPMMLTAEGAIMGTPAYIAPELIKGEDASAASDIYGLGAVLYRLLTGQAPYEGAPNKVLAQILSADPVPLTKLRPDLPGWFNGFITRLMMRKLKLRPASARSLCEELRVTAQREGVLIADEPLGRWLRDLFAEDHQRDAQQLKGLLQTSQRPAHLKQSTRVISAVAEDVDPRTEGPQDIPTAISDSASELLAGELDRHTTVDGTTPATQDERPTNPQRAASEDEESFDDPTYASEATARVDATVMPIDPPTIFDDDSPAPEDQRLNPVRLQVQAAPETASHESPQMVRPAPDSDDHAAPRVPSRTLSGTLNPPRDSTTSSRAPDASGLTPSTPGPAALGQAAASQAALPTNRNPSTQSPLWSEASALGGQPGHKRDIPWVLGGAVALGVFGGGILVVRGDQPLDGTVGIGLLIVFICLVGVAVATLIFQRVSQQRMEERRWVLLERLGNVRKSLVLAPDSANGSNSTEPLLERAKIAIEQGNLTQAQAVLQDLEVIALSRSAGQPK